MALLPIHNSVRIVNRQLASKNDQKEEKGEEKCTKGKVELQAKNKSRKEREGGNEKFLDSKTVKLNQRKKMSSKETRS